MPPRTAVVGTGSAPVACMASRQVLWQLVSLSDRWDCGAPRAMEAVAATIEQALAGALLWNETAGMYAPSSGNCAQLTDVWGSALALECLTLLLRELPLPPRRWAVRRARARGLHALRSLRKAESWVGFFPALETEPKQNRGDGSVGRIDITQVPSRYRTSPIPRQ